MNEQSGQKTLGQGGKIPGESLPLPELQLIHLP